MSNKAAYFVALPLLATAIVGADTLHTHSMIQSAANVRERLTTVTTQESSLGPTLGAYYFQLNKNNQLTGQIFAIDKVTGQSGGVGSLDVFLVQQSQVKVKTTTDPSGRFTTPTTVVPGAYTFCVAGDDGFLAYGIFVDEPPPGDEPAESGSLPDPGDDTAPKGPFANISFQELGPPAPNNERITAAVVPPEFTALQEIMQSYVPADVGQSIGGSGSGSRINVEKSVVEGGFQVSLQADGTLTGRIAPIASDEDIEVRLREMSAILIQDDRIYRDAAVNPDGTFTMPNVRPGVYGFAAAGQDGFAALSFQAVPVDPEVEETNYGQTGPFRNASHKSAVRVKDELVVTIAPENDVPFIRSQIERLNQQDEAVPLADGGAPPLPAGGPGAFGPTGAAGPGSGLGDFGPLVEGALAAWILAEAFRDRTPLLVQPPPMSPF